MSVNVDEPDKIYEAYICIFWFYNNSDSKYDFWGLFSFVPGIRKLEKPDPKKQWCSENAANLLKTYGYADLIKTTISPDQLLKVVKNHKEAFNAVLSYYIM